jgi:multicomponent Na+:H+ antiporter subunit G
MLFTIISVACVLAGLLFFLGTTVGLIRFPDFYTRMHAAGKGDTLSTLLIIAGIAIHYLSEDFSWLKLLVALKILAIGLFISLTSPTSTHALMKAGFDDGIEPVLDDKKKKEGDAK